MRNNRQAGESRGLIATRAAALRNRPGFELRRRTTSGTAYNFSPCPKNRTRQCHHPAANSHNRSWRVASRGRRLPRNLSHLSVSYRELSPCNYAFHPPGTATLRRFTVWCRVHALVLIHAHSHSANAVIAAGRGRRGRYKRQDS